MIDSAKQERLILSKVLRRCWSCLKNRDLYRPNYFTNGLSLKVKVYDFRQVFDICRHGSMLERTRRQERINTNRSPHESDHTLEDDSTLDGAEYEDYLASKKVPYCTGYINRFKKLVPINFTHIAFPWLGANFKVLTNNEKELVLSNLFKIRYWNPFNKTDNKWKILDNKTKLFITRRQRYKLVNRGWINSMIDKLVENPLILRPYTPIINILWPFLDQDLKDFFRNRIREGEQKTLINVADNLLSKVDPSLTTEYINTKSYKGMVFENNEWVEKQPVNTRKLLRNPDLLREEDLDKIHNSLELWFKLRHYKIHEGEYICSFCGTDTKPNTNYILRDLKNTTHDEFYWLTSRCDITKICLNHLNELKREYRELVRRGVYNPIDINYKFGVFDDEEEV